jgi:hypothetical protein
MFPSPQTHSLYQFLDGHRCRLAAQLHKVAAAEAVGLLRQPAQRCPVGAGPGPSAAAAVAAGCCCRWEELRIDVLGPYLATVPLQGEPQDVLPLCCIGELDLKGGRAQGVGMKRGRLRQSRLQPGCLASRAAEACCTQKTWGAARRVKHAAGRDASPLPLPQTPLTSYCKEKRRSTASSSLSFLLVAPSTRMLLFPLVSNPSHSWAGHEGGNKCV